MSRVFFLLLLVNQCFAQTSIPKDATLLKGNPAADNIIYITKFDTAAHYNHLRPIRIDTTGFYFDYYLDYWQHASMNREVKKMNLKNFPSQWYPLYQYRKQWMLYNPCDGIFCDGILVTDTSMIEESPDAPFPNLIIEASWKNDSTFYLSTLDYNQDTIDFAIHFLPKFPGVAIWEELDSELAGYKMLRLDSRFAGNFSVIVNQCEKTKATEFREWEVPDWNLLLHHKN